MDQAHDRERALVIAALTGQLAESWPVREDLGRIEWTWIAHRVGRLALGGRLWSELIRAGLDRDVPGAVREELERSAQEIAAHGALRAEAARRAGRALAASGVPWMPMKGAALALLWPEYATTRPAADVDLVVAPGDLERAVTALACTHRVLRELRDYDGAERDADAAMRDGVHHLYSFEGVGGVPVELHHAFPGLTSREATEGIFSRATSMDVEGVTVRVPAKDDLLGTACVHVYEVHATNRMMVLRHLADTAEFVRAGASPEVAQARYDVAGRSSVAESMRTFETAVRQVRERSAPQGGASEDIDPGLSRRAGTWVRNARATARHVIGRLRRHGSSALVPPRAFMISVYGPRAAGKLLPLLHMHRWGAILLRVMRRER